MRFHQLLEGHSRRHIMSQDEVTNLIRTQGAKWIKLTRGRPLYRGLRGSPEDGYADAIVYESYPISRVPTHSSEETQKVYDEILSQKNAKALRSNSVFVTSSENDALFYSDGATPEPFVFVALGDFHYSFISGVQDLYGDWTEESNADVYVSDEETTRRLMKKISDKIHVDEKLSLAIKNQDEVYVTGNNGYMLVDQAVYNRAIG